MKKNKEKIVSTLMAAIGIITISLNSYAHSGRTDANGGHKDNNNKSGLGSYHYHCGGNPAHLHPNGVCKYSSSSTPKKPASTTPKKPASSTTKKSATSATEATKKPITSTTKSPKQTVSSDTEDKNVIVESEKTEISTKIDAESIQINEKIEEIKVGESKQLTVAILPDNVTEKNVIWKSSDESIVTISETGVIMAKKVGQVTITASTSNEKNNSITVNVIEEKKEESNIIENTTSTQSNVNEVINGNQENSNPMAGLVTIGAIGGGGYWAYKKHKNNKEEK